MQGRRAKNPARPQKDKDNDLNKVRKDEMSQEELKGTNRAKFAIIRRFVQMFAGFCRFSVLLEIRAVGRRRFSKKTAGNR